MLTATPGEWVRDFESSNIFAFRWADADERKRGTLLISFYNQQTRNHNERITTYEYYNVPYSHYQDMVSEARRSTDGGSVGRYIYKNIKRAEYAYDKIAESMVDGRPESIDLSRVEAA